MDRSCSDDSGIEEEWAGGGQGPTGGGPEQEGRGRAGGGPTTSIIRSTGGALTYQMTAETLRVQAEIACVIYTCTCTVTTARKWY